MKPVRDPSDPDRIVSAVILAGQSGAQHRRHADYSASKGRPSLVVRLTGGLLLRAPRFVHWRLEAGV
jgi:hypothetical protein